MKLLYLPLWFFRAKFMGRKAPLQTVLFILDRCNLSCKHCSVYNHKNPVMLTMEEIKQEMEYSYRLGSRFIDLEGGEPMMWKDGNKTLNDVIDMARTIGFYSVTVTTNAQLPFAGCKADSIWVSLDGIGQYHDRIRGQGAFDRLIKNIENQNHPSLSVNMAINTENIDSVEQTIQFAKAHPKIKSISLNFHTPYKGTEHLWVDWEQRTKVIDQIIDYKQRGYPIMNSVSGLKRMKDLRFKKQCWITNFITTDRQHHPMCAGADAQMCQKCGFCMAGEMASVMNLSPDTLLAGIKLRME